MAENNDPRTNYNPQPYYQGQTPRPPGPGFTPPPGYYQPGYQQESGNPLGTSSFIIAVIAGLAIIISFVAVLSKVGPGGQVNQNDPMMMTFGCVILLAMLAAFIGMGLGIAGCVQQNRKKVLAILGLIFNSAIALGMGTLMLIGMSMQ